MIIGEERTGGNGVPNEVDELIKELDGIASGETEEFSDSTKALLKTISDEIKKTNDEFASGDVVINPGAISLYRKIVRFLKSLQTKGAADVEIVKANMRPQISPNELEIRTSAFVLSGDDLLEFADFAEQAHSVEIMPGTDGFAHIVFNIQKLWIPVINA
jgi:hypothetical protein